MSNYNWPMTFGELCIAEAERVILRAAEEYPERLSSRCTITGIVSPYWYNKIVRQLAYVTMVIKRKWPIEDWTDGTLIELTIKPSDIPALRRVLYHGDTNDRIKAWGEIDPPRMR